MRLLVVFFHGKSSLTLFSLLCKHLQVCLILLKGAGFLTSNPIGGKGFIS
jgi:hypothetical protein